MGISQPQHAWGYRWRSATWFIMAAMAIALFTDTFLANFIVPILPYLVENRIGLDPSHTQTASSWLLAESAAVSVIVRVPLAHLADQSSSKRSWLLWALVIALASTLLTAFGSSLFVLLTARLVQAAGSSIIWVVGVTTVADNVPLQHIGKTYAVVFMASSAGISVGPMLAGTLFQLAGYWPAWSSAFAVIAIDIVVRLLMVERPRRKQAPSSNDTETSVEMEETAPFLGGGHGDSPSLPQQQRTPNFYQCIFRKPRFLGGLYCTFIWGLLDTTFSATLPLHVREVFGWGSMESGLIFACLQVPRMVFSPLAGWLKDRVGTRAPTVAAFVTLAPLVWCLGVPGNDDFLWVNASGRGPSLYVLVMVLIGVQSAALNGAGSIEATLAATELEKEYPNAFGPNGGKSRAIAISGVSWTFGTFVGPVVAGALNNRFGYYVMNCVVGGACAFSAVVAFVLLRSRVSY